MPFSQGGSSSTGGAGSEINYTQITAPVAVTGTSNAAPTTVISPGAVTFDGNPVLLTVFCPNILCDTTAGGDLFSTSLFEGATELAILGRVRTLVAANPGVYAVTFQFRFTPSAASHTYTIGCYVTSNASASFSCGAGGSGALAPAFARFTRV